MERAALVDNDCAACGAGHMVRGRLRRLREGHLVSGILLLPKGRVEESTRAEEAEEVLEGKASQRLGVVAASGSGVERAGARAPRLPPAEVVEDEGVDARDNLRAE